MQRVMKSLVRPVLTQQTAFFNSTCRCFVTTHHANSGRHSNHTQTLTPDQLTSAALHKSRHTASRKVRDMLAARAEKNQLFSIARNERVIDAVFKMFENDIGCLIVVDEELRGIGLVTERDYINRAVIRGKAPDTPVEDIMTPKTKLTTVTPNTDISECVSLLHNGRFRHLPVIEHDEITGVVSVKDLFREMKTHYDSEVKQIENLIQFPIW